MAGGHMISATLCFQCSIDSLLVGMAYRSVERTGGSVLAFATLCGTFDALATLLAASGSKIGIIFFVSVFTCGLLGMLWRRALGVLMLLALMSVDNLLSPGSSADAFTAGAASFAMAGVGYLCAEQILRLARSRKRSLVALSLCGASLIGLLIA